MADLPKPFMWTLSATVEARQTTWHCCLWFSDPQNSSWEPLYTADQLDAYAAAKVAEERAKFPNLTPVIHWLENGCDPLEAAKELRIYQHAIRGTEAASRGE